MKRQFALLVIIAIIALPIMLQAACDNCGTHNAAPKETSKPNRTVLNGYNKVNRLGEDYTFTYSFDKKPKIGTHILKVKVFDKNKKLTGNFEVFAQSDMPSMRGAHATGLKKLKANKRGELLLPIDFVMRGEWEVELVFKQAGKTVFTGFFNLNI